MIDPIQVQMAAAISSSKNSAPGKDDILRHLSCPVFETVIPRAILFIRLLTGGSRSVNSGQGFTATFLKT